MRQGDVLLLRKWKPEHTRVFFEVVIVRKSEAEEIFGKRLPRREQMPSNEQWGTLGWSPIDLEAAKIRFEEKVKTTSATEMPRIMFTKSAKWLEMPETENEPILELEAS